jgi:transposase-like protein
MPVTQETLSIVEAANRLSIASTTLMSWIEKARADGPNGGVVRRKRYPDLIITWDSNELRVLPW